MIVRNLLYKDGYKDIILLKILQEETENQYHIIINKLQDFNLKVEKIYDVFSTGGAKYDGLYNYVFSK